MATNDLQERRLDEWNANPNVHKMDVTPLDNGVKRAYMFSLIAPRSPRGTFPDIYELIGVGYVKPDGEWEMHTPTPEERDTIRPEPPIEEVPIEEVSYEGYARKGNTR